MLAAGLGLCEARYIATLSPIEKAAHESAQHGTEASGMNDTGALDEEAMAERLEVSDRIASLEKGSASDKEQAKMLRQLLAAEAPAHAGGE